MPVEKAHHAAIALVLLGLLSGCDEGICDAASLESALAASVPGDVVPIGLCRIEGAFVVPAGVTLRGVGIGSSTLASSGGGVVLEVEGGETDTWLQAFRVESFGAAAVVVRGPGNAVLEDLAIEARRGIGVGIDGTTVRMDSVSIDGEVLAASLRDPRWLEVQGSPIAGACPLEPCACEPGTVDEEGARVCSPEGRFVTWTSVFGIYARDARLELSDVDVRGIASYGVVTDRTEIIMLRGSVATILGVGVLAREGTIAFEETRIEGISRGLRGQPSYALLTDAATVSSDALVVRDNDDFGAVHVGATVAHRRLHAERNGNAGLWIGGASSVVLEAESQLIDNGFAGVLLNDSSAVTLDTVRVEGTAIRVVNTSLFGMQEVGDGIVLSGTSDVSMRLVTLAGNERAGLMVDVSAGVDTLSFDDVSVDAGGTAFGALAGPRDVALGQLTIGAPAGWDIGIARTGAASANDLAASGAFDIVVTNGPESATGARGIVAPMY